MKCAPSDGVGGTNLHRSRVGLQREGGVQVGFADQCTVLEESFHFTPY